MDYFCLLISSQLDKLKYDTNLFLAKDFKNKLKKDSIIKLDSIYRIENEDVLIADPLGNLRYKLMCKNDIIYDSKEKLYRKHIFFNSWDK